MRAEEAFVPSLQPRTTVEVFGTCFEKPEVVRNRAERGDLAALTALQGSYSLAIRSGAAVTLAASAVGPSNLFYMHTRAGFFYGATVLEVLKRARTAWRWNWAALADMTALDHCVDGETLHADVRKLEPGSVIRFDGEKVSSQRIPWNERFHRQQASSQGALDALVESCRRHARGDIVVSMSAGFDSRLLLACLIACGIKPRLISMGHAASTDVRVAAAIARQFGLQFDAVPLDASSYATLGSDIVGLTGGSKGFQHWHTYAYAARSPLTRDSRIFIGANGEAARSYYLDKGLASLAAQALASEATKQVFWTRKLRPIFLSDELQLLDPRLAAQFSAARIGERVRRLRELSPGPLLAGLDRFYTDQRVGNFIANGLSLVGAHARVAAPMLDQTWMSHIWNLPREWKMGSRWHRFAIGRLCPALLGFEEEGTGQPMHRGPGTLYWLPLRKRREPVVPYMDYDSLLRSPEIREFVDAAPDRIASLAQPELVPLLFGQHGSGPSRMRAAAFVLTMLFHIRCLQSAGIELASE